MFAKPLFVLPYVDKAIIARASKQAIHKRFTVWICLGLARDQKKVYKQVLNLVAIKYVSGNLVTNPFAVQSQNLLEPNHTRLSHDYLLAQPDAILYLSFQFIFKFSSNHDAFHNDLN